MNRADANIANNPDFDQTVDQMPAILDFTLPFRSRLALRVSPPPRSRLGGAGAAS